MPVPSPAFTYGLIIATIAGTITHVLLGGDSRRMVALMIAGCVGFSIGQAIGEIFDINVLAVGPLNVFSATLGALLATASTAILSSQRKGL